MIRYLRVKLEFHVNTMLGMRIVHEGILFKDIGIFLC